MARISVLGGTGYAGSNIVTAAAQAGHDVTSYSRNAPEEPTAGVDYRTGDVADEALLAQAVEGADVVVAALSPRGALEGEGKLRSIYATVAGLALQQGARFGVVGGAGSLFASEGGPLVFDTPSFPDAIKPEAAELTAVLEDLRAADQGLDWFFVSPAGGFGAWAPGEATGEYRIGGDVLLVDEAGESFISGADFGHAVVNEIEVAAHSRKRFTVAY